MKKLIFSPQLHIDLNFITRLMKSLKSRLGLKEKNMIILKNISVPIAIVFLSLLSLQVNATEIAKTIPFDLEQWEINDKDGKFIDYLGQKSLLLKTGNAIIKDSNFTSGIIEYDIAFSSERTYAGVMWRWQNSENYEKFFMRAHQSGQPDANQYTPVFNGLDGWQLYYGEGYGAPVDYVYNEWMHVKLVVFDGKAEVYIRDMNKPALLINDLKRATKSGKLGLIANSNPTYFSNFSYTEMSKPSFKGVFKTQKEPAIGTIMSWSVSDAFDEKSLENKLTLTEEDKNGRSWTSLASETNGLANLAKIQATEKAKDTIFARITINSDKDQTKLFRFGFSDKAKVYLNNQLIYGGNNIYGTRDYRFLGTIGLFDELYLPLKKGDNELYVAVSEIFGGWGLIAELANIEGISIK